MPADPKEMLEQKLAELQKQHDEAIKLAGDIAAKTQETDEKIAKAQEEAVELRQKIDELETRLARPEALGKGDEADEKEYKKAFDAYMRKGDLGAERELKAMSSDSSPDGGYFVPRATESEITKIVYESSPIRQMADVQTISTQSYVISLDDDEVGSAWIGEQGTPGDSDTPQIGLIEIPVHGLYSQPKATQVLLDDSAVDIASWLAGKVGEKFGRDEATAFVSGNGVNKPMGFLSYSAWAVNGTYERNKLEQIVSGAAGGVTDDGLIDLQNALEEEFQAGANFVMKRSTFGSVRKLKDGNGNYMLGIGLDISGAQQMTLLGKPVKFANDMPAVAANALSIAYGDFKKGYQVVDRKGITVLIDPYTGKPFTKFYTTKRVGGGVKNFKAIKIQKLAAS